MAQGTAERLPWSIGLLATTAQRLSPSFNESITTISHSMIITNITSTREQTRITAVNIITRRYMPAMAIIGIMGIIRDAMGEETMQCTIEMI